MEEIRVIFDGPPGPESGRFVEVEDAEGRSIKAGEWHGRKDGLWELRILNVELDHRCLLCGEQNADHLDMDGCRDPHCPERA